jgi:hypothetical protein
MLQLKLQPAGLVLGQYTHKSRLPSLALLLVRSVSRLQVCNASPVPVYIIAHRLHVCVW